MAYILQTRMFWTLQLTVNASVLIPRPETEALVEVTLSLKLPERARVLDLGTGSGAIALALASERPGWRLTASDHSQAALRVAQQNQRQLQLDNVCFCHSNWFAGLAEERFDAIVSNPPYIAEHDKHLQQGDLRFEPRAALTAGLDGLYAIRHIVRNAAAHLTESGWLLLEHGFDQAGQVRRLLAKHGFAAVRTMADLSGQPRVTVARMGALSPQ